MKSQSPPSKDGEILRIGPDSIAPAFAARPKTAIFLGNFAFSGLCYRASTLNLHGRNAQMEVRWAVSELFLHLK
jgi:hypothetical protein